MIRMDTETRFSVKQLAEMAGVSARTLHYYDEIGLLRPARDPANGYRQYDRPAALRLQQILFLRELGLSLDEIRDVLDQPDFELVTALEHHRQALRQRQRRLARLLQTVERTIEHLKGHTNMDSHDLFEGFSEEQQKRYDEEAREAWGNTDAWKESQRRWATLTEADKQRMMDEGKAIYRDVIAAMPTGPASEQTQACIARWHQHMRYFYEPTTEMLRGLGDLYNDHPEFAANFARMHPDLATFMREAIRVYCDKLES
jgi:MerR family transcriptional regulator, thiopeptide resistance regulator